MTPASLSNIEVVEVTADDGAAAVGTVTLGLLNAGQLQQITNDGSLEALTVNNVAAGATTINVQNTSAATTIQYKTTTGTQSVDLNVSNVTGGAAVTIAGVETVTVSSNDAASSVDLELSAATKLIIDGSADLTVAELADGATDNVSSVDASAFEGNLTLTMGAQTGVLSTTDITVLGGAGNDAITMTGVAPQDYTVTLGAGNDTLTDTGITVNDTVIGGEGTDTLSTTFERANVLAATVNGVDGIDVLSLSNDLDGSINAVNVDSTINTLTVAVASKTSGDLTAQASTIVGGAGEFTVNLGTSGVDNGASLGDALTINDTGSATTDTLNLNNTAINTTNNTNVNVFAVSANAQNVTVGGYENVVLNTGTASPVTQTIGTLAINVDNTNGVPSAAASLTVNGSNRLSVTSLTTNSTGLFTVDASALNVLSTADGVTISGTTQGVGGTASITGSAGNDTIDVGNFASTIVGGTGNDNLTGGTAADSITGDEGADTISGAGGNDTLKGGAGNDTITADVAGSVSIDGGVGNDTVSVGAVLSSGDTVDGGEGVDTLSVTAAITGTTGVGVRNFEILQTTVDQVMSNTVNNTGWTTVFADAASVAITNAGSALTTYQVDETATTTHSLARLVDTGTDSLTIQTVLNASPAYNSINAFTANDEETITIDTSAGADSVAGGLTITTLNAANLTSLTATGDHSVEVTTLSGATGLTSITNSLSGSGSNQPTFTINAGSSTSATTFTANGSSTGRSTVTTGSGADIITAALAAELYATGGAGNDSITGGNLNDSLAGETGADTLLGGVGNDTLNGGQGADSIVGGDGVDTFTAAHLSGIKDSGTTDTTGVVVNLGSSTLSAADILAATGNSYTANGNTSVASGAVAYLDNVSDTKGVGLSTVQDTLSNIENVIGTSGADYIVGSSAANTIESGAGNDVVTGGNGADTINVGEGTDTVRYTTGGQTLTGSFTSGGSVAAADVITGLAANDIVQLYSAANVQGVTTTVGTTILTAITAGGVALLSGLYNASAGTFTVGTASATNDDLMIQWADGTSVNSIVLSGDYYEGSATTVKLVGTAATDIFTITAVS